jgi:hypothetical protein
MSIYLDISAEQRCLADGSSFPDPAVAGCPGGCLGRLGPRQDGSQPKAG